jgi:hypothetical protein
MTQSVLIVDDLGRVGADGAQHAQRVIGKCFYFGEHARFSATQEIYIAPIGVWHRVEADECIQTEISRKFTLASLSAKLERLGFATRRISTDPRNCFALLLLERILSS